MDTLGTKKILKLDADGYRIENQPVKTTKSGDKLHNLMFASELGLTLVLPIVVGAFFGWWLDGKFNSLPKLT